MRRHRIAEFIDNIEAGVHRRIESERIIGVLQIVVDRAGNTDRGHAVIFAEDLRAAERSVAADHHKSVDAVFFKSLHRLLLPLFRKHFQASRRTKFRTAALHDIGNAAHFHGDHFILDQPRVTSFDAAYFHTVVNRRAHHRADRRVHTGRVAAARQ